MTIVLCNRNTRREAGPLGDYLDILSTEHRALRYASETIRHCLAAAKAFGVRSRDTDLGV
jgi:hypothetical protein